MDILLVKDILPSLRKRVYSKRKEFSPLGSKSRPLFWLDCSTRPRTTSIFTTVNLSNCRAVYFSDRKWNNNKNVCSSYFINVIPSHPAGTRRIDVDTTSFWCCVPAQTRMNISILFCLNIDIYRSANSTCSKVKAITISQTSRAVKIY